MRGPRQPAIAPGIYPDAGGFEVRIVVGRRAHSKRFPAQTSIATMQLWQASERKYYDDLAIDAAAQLEPPARRGTLAGDVLHYLKRREGRKGYKSDRSHLKAWTTKYGTRPRAALRAHDAEVLAATWRAAGRSEKTIRHRFRVLRELYHALDGPRARTPLDGIKLPAPPRPDPKPVPWDTIRTVAASLREGLTIQQRCGPNRTMTTVHRAESAHTYARFLVRALTGQRADQIMKAKPDDVDLDARIWWVRPAKGGHPIPFPLDDEMIAAWRVFIAADAWGSWDWRSFTKVLRRHGWPKDVPPKNLRHTFAIDHLRAGTDLGDVQGLLGHSSIQTTRTYYAPVLVSRLEAAVQRRRLALVPADGATPPVPRAAPTPRQFPRLSDTPAKQATGRRRKRNA